MSGLDNLQGFAMLLVGCNLKQLAAFAFQEYQRLGRGVVVVDWIRPDVMYLPQGQSGKLVDGESLGSAVLEQVARYDPVRSFCLYFGNLSELLAEHLGFEEVLPQPLPVAMWLMPALDPQDCLLAAEDAIAILDNTSRLDLARKLVRVILTIAILVLTSIGTRVQWNFVLPSQNEPSKTRVN